MAQASTAISAKKLRTAVWLWRTLGPSAVVAVAYGKIAGRRLPRAGSRGLAPEAPNAGVFGRIYETKGWNSTESVSGPGSTLGYTAGYRRHLARCLADENFRSLFDAPCGDFNWMPHAISGLDLRYIGGDIVAPLIEENRSRYPGFEFRCFDITTDDFPDVDVWHCRDCLLHLSYKDMSRAFEKYLRSEIPNVLFSSFRFRPSGQNSDIETGMARMLDLTFPPFNFPQPARWLRDHRPFRDFPRYVGLWRRTNLREPMKRFVDAMGQPSAARR